MVVRALTFLLLMSFGVAGWASNKVVKMAIPAAGYPPFVVVQEDRTVTGLMIEPLMTALNNLGYQLKFSFVPEVRAQVLLNKGEIDVRTESPYFIDNPKDYFWSIPIISLDDVLVFHQQSNHSYSNMNDVEGAEIVTHLGYGYPTLQPLFDAKKAHRRDMNSERAMLRYMLRAVGERKTAAVMNKQVAEWIINQDKALTGKYQFSELVIGSAPFQFQYSYSPKMQMLAPKIDQELKKLYKDGTLLNNSNPKVSQ